MKNLLTYLLWVFSFCAFSQSVDLESFGKSPPLKITGGLSANTVFYKSNVQNSREPFTYFLQGNLNVSLYEFTVPLSYSYSNQGDQLGYQLPFNLNRLSLHPKYKWVTGHIGDVNMTFSPYTLNGHQFTGAGVDMTPNQGFTLSAMYGRLLKATEPNDENQQTIPSYKRIGFGFKTLFERELFSIGLSTFYAVDQENSITINADEEGVLPKENMALGFEGAVSLTNDLKLNAEYATTAITQDTRAEKTAEGSSGLLAGIFNNRASTEYYKAYKLGLQYRFYEASLGVGYERIDPGYETLGAYFFNNDFENLTLNVNRPFFENKLNLAFNLGYQKDDLKDQKTNSTNRFVGTVNATLNASERLNISGSYSNFSTFTNVRINQFDAINDDNLLDNAIDSLNYRQVSKNANLDVSYIISNKKTLEQSVSLNYNVSDIANEQGGVVRVGDASTFHNISTTYIIGVPNRNLNVTPAVNATYNTIGRENAMTWGPTLTINKSYFENTLKAVFSSSYNTTTNSTGKINIANIRLGISYVLWEKHNFSLNTIQLFKNSSTISKLNEFTATLGYNYAFDLLKKREKAKKEKEKRKKEKNGSIKIKYKQYRFEGLPSAITQDILKITNTPDFGPIPSDKVLELKDLEKKLIKANTKKEKVYRENAIAYIKSLEAFKAFEAKYQDLTLMAYHQLIREAQELDYRLEKQFIEINGDNNNPKFKKTPEFSKNLEMVNKRYDAHKEMLIGLKTWDILKDLESEQLKVFKDANINKVYIMYFKNKGDEKIINFLEYKLADLYHKRQSK